MFCDCTMSSLSSNPFTRKRCPNLHCIKWKTLRATSYIVHFIMAGIPPCPIAQNRTGTSYSIFKQKCSQLKVNKCFIVFISMFSEIVHFVNFVENALNPQNWTKDKCWPNWIEYSFQRRKCSKLFCAINSDIKMSWAMKVFSIEFSKFCEW